MSSPRRLVVIAPLVALVLAGCSSPSDTDSQLRSGVNDVIEAANAGKTAELRTEADALLRTISKLGGSGKLPAGKETQLRTLVLAILAKAGQLDPPPSPAPSPSPSMSPSPSPSPSPKPSPSPPPSPSPSPSPSPPPSPSPSPSPDKKKGPPPESSLTPSPPASVQNG